MNKHPGLSVVIISNSPSNRLLLEEEVLRNWSIAPEMCPNAVEGLVQLHAGVSVSAAERKVVILDLEGMPEDKVRSLLFTAMIKRVTIFPFGEQISAERAEEMITKGATSVFSGTPIPEMARQVKLVLDQLEKISKKIPKVN